jgi:hypothetical protein
VFAFECRRAMRWSRLLVVCGLAVFPAAILAVIRHEGGFGNRQEAWCIALFALVPEIVCLLGLLLWITPQVQTEVEGKTWPYLAVRPAGKVSILLGKYAAGVFWSMLTGWLALCLALSVLGPLAREVRVWKVMASLVALSCTAYGALFTLFGVMFLRRGMIVAVAYTLLEFVVRLVAGVARQLTVQYHLQGLLVHWMRWGEGNQSIEAFFGSTSPGQHVLVLAAYTVVLLTAAAAILLRRELVSATDAP